MFDLVYLEKSKIDKSLNIPPRDTKLSFSRVRGSIKFLDMLEIRDHGPGERSIRLPATKWTDDLKKAAGAC